MAWRAVRQRLGASAPSFCAAFASSFSRFPASLHPASLCLASLRPPSLYLSSLRAPRFLTSTPFSTSSTAEKQKKILKIVQQLEEDASLLTHNELDTYKSYHLLLRQCEERTPTQLVLRCWKSFEKFSTP
eukprot:TRINITY_DN15290_c0_g1_i1.p1 TRINITY_DN15290_c0_g1~~TRINITY_DN15290_c0_g1_i1.p1  ORF type:complete len:148 (-),score=31.63 TRINITY_DN15290_c0_g1_i1:350-739(-)